MLTPAIEWLLDDWLMAHRESERGAAIEIRSGRPADAAMIVAAAAVSSARARTRTVIGLSEIGPPLIGRPHLRGRG